MGKGIFIRTDTKGSASKDTYVWKKDNEWCPPSQCPGASTHSLICHAIYQMQY